MLVVAISALGVWGVKMWRLSCYYSARARSSKTSECLFELEAERSMETFLRRRGFTNIFDGLLTLRDPVESILVECSKDAADDRAKAAYYSALAQKYERAARYPWLPVELDPP
jgi:hypothetical protein